MARISFTAIVSEIVGKLAGSVFQYSYGGWQIHTRVSPGNPQTGYQQLRRGWYGFIRANWRNLTNVQRQTFDDNAPSPGQGFNFFTACNINLILVEEPMIDLFTPTASPDQFDFTITAADPDTLSIQASGLITTVPTDTKLLIYATREKPSSAPFTNPSDYSPIISFDEGTDLSTPQNIIAEYNSRFGQITGEKYLAMKSVLISKINGTRSAEFLTDTTTEEMAKFVKIYSNATPDSSIGTGATDVFIFSMPGNTIVADGDCLTGAYWGHSADTGVDHLISWSINGSTYAFLAYTLSAVWKITFNVVRSSSSDGYYVVVLETSEGSVQVGEGQFGVIDWSSAMDIKLTLQAPISGSVTCDSGYINKELI